MVLSHALQEIEIPRSIHDRMIAHGLAEAPHECCGLLGGTPPRATSFHPLRNAAARSEVRYDADPVDLITALRALREAGLDVVAIYHSHPATEAVPSTVDLAQNHWGPTPRLIISLMKPAAVVRVWRLEPDAYHEIPWRMVETA